MDYDRLGVLIIQDMVLFPNSEIRMESDDINDKQIISFSENSSKHVLVVNPIKPKITTDIFKTLYALFDSPIASFEATSVEIAFGTPIEHIVKKTVYTWNADKNNALPVSLYPVLFVK